MPAYPSLSGCCSGSALTVCGVYVAERAGDSVTANARRDFTPSAVSPTVSAVEWAPSGEYPPRGYKRAAIPETIF